MRKIISAVLAAALAGSTLSFPALADEGDLLSLYSGCGTAGVKEDPTGSGRGMVFGLDGYDAVRGNDKEMGRNPFLEIPWEYLYDKSGNTYRLKSSFSVSFDLYTMTTGTRYAFYTGTDDTVRDGVVTGLYFIPDTGNNSYIEAVTEGKQQLYAGGEYASIKREWHRFTVVREENKFTLLKDGTVYAQTESDYEYSSEQLPLVRIGYSPYSGDPGAYAYVDNIEILNGEETVYTDTGDGDYGVIEGVPEEPEQIVINSDISDGSETQALIDSRPDIQRRMENLDRGLTAVNGGSYGFISWRWLGTESSSVMYNLYKNGEKLNQEPLDITNYIDYDAKAGDKYSVAAVENGVEGERCEETELLGENYLEIPIDIPEGGVELQTSGAEEQYTYIANDATTADLDGDGEYEIILKWDPSNSRDSANVGHTGPTIFDAYKLDGTRLWRINLGKNVRSGAHDTQMLAADFDGDGRAEFALRTADGTIAGDGTVIGDPEKDWRNDNGKNLTGPLYVTVFDGETGAVIDTTDYIPQSQGAYGDKTWDIDSWGDDWGNRSERYNAAVAYLDGENPAMVFARGYYGRTALAAFTLEDGKIKNQWVFDTYEKEEGELGWDFGGQGNHSVAVADVDFDGCDEIIYGSTAYDNDGSPMYTTGLNHGDAQHTGDLIPSRPGLETFTVHEWGAMGQDMRDSRTGELIWSSPFGTIDVGRGTSADIDPRYEGAESWSAMEMLISADGELITDRYSIPANFLTWWDGDLGREVQDGIIISKWDPYTSKVKTIFTAENCHSNNAGKANPSLTADLFGDWREEVVYPTQDNSALRIYTTTIPTQYRLPTLMHDPQYRASVAVQNVGYNQPAHTGYYLGYDTKSVPVPQIYVMDGENKVTNPELDQKEWDISQLYRGDRVELAVDSGTALVNGVPYYIDNDDTSITAYMENDRTMVPYRFIAEAFGAGVSWDKDTSSVTVKNEKAEIVMTAGQTEYTVNGESRTMDTVPVIRNDRMFVPVRMIAEAMGLNVEWYPEQKIVLAENGSSGTDAENAKDIILTASVSETNSSDNFENGEKIEPGQANVLSVRTLNGEGGEELFDLDYQTSWTLEGDNILMAELDGYYAISSVYISFADGDSKQHEFKIYNKWDIGEDDADLTNRDGWDLSMASANSGVTTDPEKYIFPVPKYGKYIKIMLDDPADAAEISEIAVIVV